MLTLEDIRQYATILPEVEEKTHFGRPGFRVNDKLFVMVNPGNGGGDAIVHISQQDAAAIAADGKGVYEEVWRSHGGRQIYVGLWVDLSRVTPERMQELVELAWRNKAPKRLVSTFDAANTVTPPQG